MNSMLLVKKWGKHLCGSKHNDASQKNGVNMCAGRDTMLPVKKINKMCAVYERDVACQKNVVIREMMNLS